MNPIKQKAGRKGGQARTPAKQAASRENGKKGGRPRLTKTQTLEITGVAVLGLGVGAIVLLL
jgi:hypothetical protein